MKKNKDIAPINSNGQSHGYQQWYNHKSKLSLRVTMKHGQPLGYEEWHFTSGFQTNYHIR
jgi:hypothetical protein